MKPTVLACLMAVFLASTSTASWAAGKTFKCKKGSNPYAQCMSCKDAGLSRWTCPGNGEIEVVTPTSFLLSTNETCPAGWQSVTEEQATVHSKEACGNITTTGAVRLARAKVMLGEGLKCKIIKGKQRVGQSVYIDDMATTVEATLCSRPINADRN